MFKRFNLFVLMLLIVGQTILGPMATVGAVGSTEDEQPSIDFNTSEVKEDGSVDVEWSVDEGANIKEGSSYSTNISSKIEASEPKEEQVTVDGQDVGTIQATTDGEVTLTFTSEFVGSASGTFNVNGEVKDVDSNSVEKNESNEEEKEKKETDKHELTIEELENTKKPGGEEVIKQEKPQPAGMVLNNKSGFYLEIGKVKDFEGKEYEGDYKLIPTDEFSLSLNWHLKNDHNYKSGDTVEFDLPKQIYIDEDMENMDLKDDEDNVIAQYTITTDNKVKLTFTDYVDTHSDVKGHIGIAAKLDPNETEVEDGNITIDPIDEGEAIVVPVGPVDKNKDVTKDGEPNKSYNADEINWTVTANGSGAELKEAKVVDELPEGLEYKDGSLKVTRYQTNLVGEVVGDGVDVTSTITPEFVDQKLTIPLGNTKDKYVVKYTTTITDETKKDFTNNVNLIDEHNPDKRASKKVEIKRGEPINKSAVKDYNPVTGIIEWEIEFNYDQKSLTDVTLTDKWTPAGKVELKGDVQFIEVTIDEEGKAHDVVDAVAPSFNNTAETITDGFKVENITTDKSYRVIYKTKVKDRVIDGFTMKNVASFGGHSTDEDPGTWIGQYYGVKTAGTVNYHDKTIDWTITLNQDKHPMKNIKIEDTFTEGQTLRPDSVKVTVGGVSYDGYTLTGEGKQSFKIKFSEVHETSEIVTITYKSDFVPNEVGGYAANTALVDWIPKGSQDRIGKKKLIVGTDINENHKKDHRKNGAYNPVDKTIKWELIVNYRGNPYEELIIKDNPVGEQKLVENSIRVEELEVQSNGTEKKITDVTLNDSNLTSTEDGFTLNLGETSKTYKVIYKTSIGHNEHLDESYKNNVEVSDGDGDADKVSDTVTIPNVGTYSTKTGTEVGSTVEWSLNVNPGQHKVEDLKLKDTISDNQAYLQDTIKVYEATVNNVGKVIKGEPYSEELYEVIHVADTQTFDIEWKEEIERAFVVEYSTLFFANKGEEVSNGFVVTGTNLKEGAEQQASDKITIDRYSSSGGSGVAGFLIVDKVDKEGNKLPGAKFELWDKDETQLLISGLTDENGRISFGRLKFGDYTLIETETPDGYVAEKDKHEIKIENEYTTESDKENFVKEIENYVPVFEIELLKKDEEGNALEDAEFTLYDSNDKKIESKTTNEDGWILFDDLNKDVIYYVQETKAPKGYALDETKHTVTFEGKEKEAVKIEVKNSLRGPVQLKKVDANNESITLEGATFELQKKNGENVEVIGSFTTDENGIIETSNILEPGNYQFVETKAPQFYELDATPIPFMIDGTETKTIMVPAKNTLKQGSVELTKLDADVEGKVLEGAVFELQDIDGNVVESYSNLTTDENGTIGVTGLATGSYQFVEIKSPTGYELNEETVEIKFDIDDNQTQLVTRTAKNKIKPGTVELIKTETDFDGILVKDATFDLLDAEDKKVKTGLTTDENGRLVVEDLRPGSYKFIETRAPENFELDESSLEFTIEKDQSEILTVEARNELKENSVVLEKVDTRNKETTLAGAEFKLEKINENEIETIYEELKTDDNGLIVFKDLSDGDYQFVETKAPVGYHLNGNPLPFTIGGDDHTGKVTITAENRKRSPGGGGPPPEEDPEDPNEEDPEDPNGEDPEDPNGEDPEDPNGEGPEDPNGDNPKNPSAPGVDGDKPGNENGGSGSSGKPSDSGKPGTDGSGSGVTILDGKDKDEQKEGLLPKTATNIYNLIYIGAALLMVGLFTLIYRRRSA